MTIEKRTVRSTLAALLLFFATAFTSCNPHDLHSSKPDTGTKPSSASGQLQIHMLDVGQGDSLLIITPENKTVLIDAGLAKAGDRVIEDLERLGVKEINLAVATHPHADHIGGMLDVLKAVPVKMFLDSGQPYTTATFKKMLELIKGKIGKLTVARAGQEFELDSGVKIEVLSPSEPLLKNVRGSVENSNSVVLRLSYGDFHMLFTGDSEEETEERLLQSGMDLSAQVLKVAHHGSRYATSDEFLKRINPKIALISCGEDNDYGHPSPPTLKRLKRFGVELHRTDLEGDILITSDGRDFQVSTDHKPTGNLWEGRSPDKDE